MCTHHMQDTGQASPLSLDQLLALMDPTDVVSPVWFFTLTQRWTFIYIQVMKVSRHFEGKVTLVEGNRREGTEREVIGGKGGSEQFLDHQTKCYYPAAFSAWRDRKRGLLRLKLLEAENSEPSTCE